MRHRAAGRWSRLPTEQRNPRSQGLDALSTREVVALVLDEDARAVRAASRPRAAIARAADLLAHTLERGGDVVFLGAGTSGRLGVLEAAECPPTFGIPPRRVRAAMAGGRAAVFASREGTEDRADRGRAEARRLRRGDALVGISASGTTAFVRGALTAARARGVATVLVTCAPRRSVGRADVVIAVASGPEVLTGSSRLKAGSATKAVLNALTTAAMVRLGKVYGNLMVDLHAGSAKLRDRRRRIVAAAAQVDEETASRLLRDAKGDVKTAVVAGRLGLPARDARRRLVLAGGRVRRALER